MTERAVEFIKFIPGGEGRGNRKLSVWRWSGLTNDDTGAKIAVPGCVLRCISFIGTAGNSATFMGINSLDGIGSIGGTVQGLVSSGNYGILYPSTDGLRGMLLEYFYPLVLGGTGTDVAATAYIEHLV